MKKGVKKESATDYRDIILDSIVVLFVQVDRQFQLMHDNGLPHTTRVLRAFLEDHEIDVLPWPAPSPYANPIQKCIRHVGFTHFETKFRVQYKGETI